MPADLKNIAVYCSSSDRIDSVHKDAARALGTRMAAEKLDLVYGGGAVGLMGEVARAVRAGGGRTIGITTRFLKEKEQADPEACELIAVETMLDRRALLMERSESTIVLAGGLGTLVELLVVLEQRVLGNVDGPIAIVNTAGWFDSMASQLEESIDHGFLRAAACELYEVVPDVQTAVDHVLNTERIRGGEDRFLPSGRD